MTAGNDQSNGAARTRVGLGLKIETPENVILTYRLSGPATRLSAYLIDLLVRSTGMLMVVCFVGMFAIVLPGTAFGMLFVIWFVNEWGYFVICETLFNGKTIGKHMMGIRVIHEEGHPITFWASAARNIVRAADALPGVYGLGFLTMMLSGNFRRLGDLIGRTVVIQERSIQLPSEPTILEKIEPLSRNEIGSYRPSSATLVLIDQFLGRRQYLTRRGLFSAQRGHQLAEMLAYALAERLNYRGDRRQLNQYPMAFLARVFATFVNRDEEELSRLDIRAELKEDAVTTAAPIRLEKEDVL